MNNAPGGAVERGMAIEGNKQDEISLTRADKILTVLEEAIEKISDPELGANERSLYQLKIDRLWIATIEGGYK